MNRIRTTTMIGALVLAAGMSTAAAQESPPPYHGWYVGATAGSSSYDDISNSDLGANRRVSDNGSGFFGLFGGYRYNDYVSGELGYRDLGEVEGLDTADGNPIDGRLAEAELISIDFVGVGHLPVWRGDGQAFSLIGKAGGYAWFSDTSNLGAGAKLEDSEDINYTAEAGFSWDSSYATLELTYRFYNNAFGTADIDTVGANFIWRFR